MTDTPHRTGYMRAINLARQAAMHASIARDLGRINLEVVQAIRTRLREFVDLYAPPSDPARDTITDGVQDGRLAVDDALALANLDGCHYARCTGGDIYAVTRFFEELGELIPTIDYTQETP